MSQPDEEEPGHIMSSRETWAEPDSLPAPPSPSGVDAFGIVRRSGDGSELDAWEMVQVLFDTW